MRKLCKSSKCPVTKFLGAHTPGVSTSGPGGSAKCTTPSK